MKFKLKQIIKNGKINDLIIDENFILTTPLIKYTLIRDNASVMKLLNIGADPNIADDWGNTPLKTACENFDYNLCKILLKWGANPNYKNCMGQTPLMILVSFSEYPASFELLLFIKMLLEYRYDTYIKDNNGRDILEYLRFYHPYSNIQELIIRWRAVLIIQYNIKIKLFINRITRRIETNKKLLNNTKLPIEIIKIIKRYI